MIIFFRILSINFIIILLISKSLTAQDFCFISKKNSDKAYEFTGSVPKKPHRFNDKDIQYVWINRVATKPQTCFRKHEGFSNLSSLPELEFKKMYWVAEDHIVSHNKETWMLLVKPGSTQITEKDLVGWVKKSTLVTSTFPLKNNYGIYHKVLLNKRDRITKKEEITASSKKLDDKIEEWVVLYNHPEMKKSHEHKFLLTRTVYYVYATDGGTPKRAKSLLISPAPSLNQSSEVNHEIRGWVNKDNLTFWDSRTALEFRPSKSVTMVDENEKELFNSADHSVSYLPPEALRTPILYKENYTLSPKLVEILKSLVVRYEKGDRIYSWLEENKGSRYSTVNGLWKELLTQFDNKELISKQSSIISAAKKNRLRIGLFNQNLEQLLKDRKDKNKKHSLDILFVIDGTRSMTTSFEDVRGAVIEASEITSSLAAQQEIPKPKFGFTIYRDQPSNLQNPEARVVVGYSEKGKPISKKYTGLYFQKCFEPFIHHKINRRNLFLAGIQSNVACDADDTFPELMFAGLKSGIQNAGFTEPTDKQDNFRIVILLGDAGDFYNSKKHSKKATVFPNSVINSFRKNEIDYLIAFDMTSRYFRKIPPKFITSVKTLEKQLKANDFLKIEISEWGKLKNTKQSSLARSIANNIEIIYREVLRKNTKSGECLDLVFNKDEELKLELVDGNGALGRYKPIELKSKRERNNANCFELTTKYQEGYIPLDETLYRKVVLVQKAEIINITSSLHSILSSDNEIKLKKAWNDFLSLILGGNQSCRSDDGNKELVMKECNRKYNGIPIHSGFMNYTREEFVELAVNPSKKKEFDKRIKKEGKFKDDMMLSVRCQAKILHQRFSQILVNLRPIGVYWESEKDKKSCRNFRILVTRDVNDNGLIEDDPSYNDNLIYREGTINGLGKAGTRFGTQPPNYILVDKFFYKEEGTDIAWIPEKVFAGVRHLTGGDELTKFWKNFYKEGVEKVARDKPHILKN